MLFPVIKRKHEYDKIKPAEVQKVYHSARAVISSLRWEMENTFMSFSARDLFVNYLPQLAMAWVSAEKAAVLQHTRAEHRVPADATAVMSFCIPLLSESSRLCIPIANCIWWNSNVSLNIAYTYVLKLYLLFTLLPPGFGHCLPGIIPQNTSIRSLLSHRACCHTCYTIQLMHYSHFKTHSLQHLKPIKC